MSSIFNQKKPAKQKVPAEENSFLETSLRQTYDAKVSKQSRQSAREHKAAQEKPKLLSLTEAIKPGLHTLDELRNTKRVGPTLPATDSREFKLLASKNQYAREEPVFTPFSENLPSLEVLERQFKRMEDDADRYRMPLKKLAGQSAFKSLYNIKACINAARARSGGSNATDEANAASLENLEQRRIVTDKRCGTASNPIPNSGSGQEVRSIRSHNTARGASKHEPSQLSSQNPTASSGKRQSGATIAGSTQMDDLNKLSSQLMRAEMMGDADRVRDLNLRIASLTHSTTTKSVTDTSRTSTRNENSAVRDSQLLMKTNSSGQLRPVASTSSLRSNATIQDMVRYEKEHTTADTVADFVASKRSVSAVKKTTDSEYDDVADDARGGITGSAVTSSNTKKRVKVDSETLDKMDRRERERAILEHKQREHAFDKCTYCLEGRLAPKHLIMAIGEFCYLHLPQAQNLVDFQCEISPIQHVPNSLLLDENVFEEMQKFKGAITRMCQAELQCDAVFIETHKYRQQYKHCVVECFPVSSEHFGEQMPFAFHNAIMASEEEWAQNVKLIDLKKRGGLQRAVPKELPFFVVEFGDQNSGYAHVIENEATFPDYFGKEVIAGVIDIEPYRYRRVHQEPFEKQCAKVAAFKSAWLKHDNVTKKSLP